MPDINVRRDQFPPDPPRTPVRLNDHEAVRSCMQPGCRNTFVADARVEQHYCGYADCPPRTRPPAEEQKPERQPYVCWCGCGYGFKDSMAWDRRRTAAKEAGLDVDRLFPRRISPYA